MNKVLRKAMVLALAGTMTMGMGTTVFAATNTVTNSNSKYTSSGDTVATDTTTINLIKDYVRGENTATDSISPAENFEFTITPYGVWNAGSSTGDANGAKYVKENMPALAKTDENGKVVDVINVKVENQTTKVTVEAEANKASSTNNKVNTQITLADFKSVGDFWYTVEEEKTKLPTTGVFYGTNDKETTNLASQNGGHSAIYYIHVQVVNNPEYKSGNAETKFLRSVTMHKTAPTMKGVTEPKNLTNKQYNTWVGNTNYTNDAKVNDIQNTYYAGNLTIKKEVTGNAGDKEKYFEVEVVFTKPAGTIVNSDISFEAVKKDNSGSLPTYSFKKIVLKGQNSKATADETIHWQKNSSDSDSNAKDALTATCNFWVKDGSTVTFKNIPYGINYTIQEKEPDDDTYKHKFTFEETSADSTQFNGNNNLTEDKGTAALTDDFSDKAQGSITDANDTVTITNNKESVIDIGVITSNAPYVAVLILAVAALVIYTRRRKDMFEE